MILGIYWEYFGTMFSCFLGNFLGLNWESTGNIVGMRLGMRFFIVVKGVGTGGEKDEARKFGERERGKGLGEIFYEILVKK